MHAIWNVDIVETILTFNFIIGPNRTFNVEYFYNFMGNSETKSLILSRHSASDISFEFALVMIDLMIL